MNALSLFKNIVFPHLWATCNIAPVIVGGLIAAGGALGGALINKSGSNSTTTTELPGYQRDPMQQYFRQMNVNYGEKGFRDRYNPKMYEGDLQARMPRWLKQEYSQYNDTGRHSNLRRTEKYLRGQVAGKGLGLTPDMQAAVMNPALDAVSSRFAQMGRSGINPSNVQAQNSAGMSALMPFYDNALQRQMFASTQLPGIDDMRMDRASLRGDALMADKQSGIDQQMYQHQFKNNKWLDRMQQWQGLLGLDGGGAGTTTQSLPGGSWLSGAIGGGMMANNLYQNYRNLNDGGTDLYSTDWQTGTQANGQNAFQQPANFGGNYSAAMGRT